MSPQFDLEEEEDAVDHSTSRAPPEMFDDHNLRNYDGVEVGTTGEEPKQQPPP